MSQNEPMMFDKLNPDQNYFNVYLHKFLIKKLDKLIIYLTFN